MNRLLAWLQAINSIAVNGRHAIFIAGSLVRIEMVRMFRTCELALSIHNLSLLLGRSRPEITSRPLFRGREAHFSSIFGEKNTGRFEEMSLLCSITAPVRSSALPHRFEEAIKKITAAVCCIGYRHIHVGVSPIANGVSP